MRLCHRCFSVTFATFLRRPFNRTPLDYYIFNSPMIKAYIFYYEASLSLIGVQESLFAGNKAKERISKRVFQENKARQIFRKTNIFLLSDTHTRFTYQGVKIFVFRKIWHALFSWNTRFGIRPFAILPIAIWRFTKLSVIKIFWNGTFNNAFEVDVFSSLTTHFKNSNCQMFPIRSGRGFLSTY